MLWTSAVLASYEPGVTHCLCIRYDTPVSAGKGYRRFVEGYIPEAEGSGLTEIEQDKWVKVALEQEYVILVLDAASEDEAVRLAELVQYRIKENMTRERSNP